MLQPSWLRPTARRRAGFRAPPCLEALEDRCLLTTLVGVTTAGALVAFDSTTPNNLTPFGTLSGIAAGQSIVAIDFDPANNQLYGLGFGSGVGQIYTINPLTAAAAAIGTPFSTKLAGTDFGMSIDPVANQIRVIDNAGENLRVSPTTGALLSTDTSINPGSDTITAVAYSNNLPGATQTTLYGYDEANNNVVTIGSLNGSPNSPNTGAVSVVGKSGVKVSGGANLGFAIDANNTAYLNLVVGGVSSFYAENLSTGAVTFINNFPAGTTLADITIAPAVKFSVSGVPTSRTQGLPSVITVTAQTVYNTQAVGYSGTVAFTSSDANASLPANSTLANGTSTFSVTLNTPGTQSITATDTVSHITGSQTGITVLANTELVGVTTNNQLVRFFSETPGSVTTVGTITGLAAGQTIVAVAFRPSTDGLYGLGFAPGGPWGGVGQLYTINPTTAVATAVGAPFSSTISGVDFGFSFDPVQDVIRVTSNVNENFRVDPNTGGLISQDTILTPTSANVVGIAYLNNFAGAPLTTLYGYNVANDTLVIVGGAGNDTSSNGGVVSTVGSSGVTSDSIGGPGETGFAIDADGAAYVNLDVGGNSGLYTINLSNGLVASNGTFASGVALRDIAVAPAASFKLGNLGSPHVAGAIGPVNVTAEDAYGNTAVGYSGTVKFSSSDPRAGLPGNITLTNGFASTNVGFNTVGSQSFTATDTVNANTTGTVSGIPVVAAVDLVGLTAGGQLVHFSSASPGNIISVGTITGVAAGQTIVAIDFRPANDQLYGLGVGGGVGQLYTIDPTTAVASPLPSSFSLLSTDTSYGFDFDPDNDVARVISNNGENLRVSPATGALVANDTALSPSSVYAGAAYSNHFLGAPQTTLYSYDFTHNDLVTIGSVNGSPNSPNSGLVSTVGPSGFTADSGTAADLGFSIGGDGVGYLNLVSGGNSALYTANLSTGTMSVIANFGSGITMLGIAEAPTTQFAVANFPSPIPANQSGTFTVTALDPYGALVPTYAGTVTFTSSDASATLPADSQLANGVGTFTATFQTQGTQSLTASDVAAPTINGTQSGIVVSGHVSPPPPPGPPVPVPVAAAKIGVIQPATVVRTGLAALDSNGNGTFDGADAVFTFGFTSDKYVSGDWSGLGVDSLGVFRATTSGIGEWVLDSNADNVYDAGDALDFYGLNSDTPVTGDWTGSGTTKIGVARVTASGAMEWVLNTTGSGSYSGSDAVDFYGANGDTPVAGDWNGSGAAKIGVVRQTSSGVLEWVLNTTGTGSYNGNDAVFFFGQNGDTPVVGDWNGDGKTDIGVVRRTSSGVLEWVLDTSETGSYTPSDAVFFYGSNAAIPVVGRWAAPAALHSGNGVLTGPVQSLATDALFASTVNQAIAAWQQAGLDPQDVARLRNVDYEVAPLGNGLLGETSGNTITIDATAQGHGWSESATPQPGQMDLFTGLAHEMGHELGLPDQSSQPGDVMYESLLTGVRKSPTTQDVDAVFAALGHS